MPGAPGLFEDQEMVPTMEADQVSKKIVTKGRWHERKDLGLRILTDRYVSSPPFIFHCVSFPWRD